LNNISRELLWRILKKEKKVNYSFDNLEKVYVDVNKKITSKNIEDVDHIKKIICKTADKYNQNQRFWNEKLKMKYEKCWKWKFKK